MDYNYGTQDVILAGNGNHVLRKGHYVYYGDNIKDLIKSANSQERNIEYFGILLDSMGDMFSIQVNDIDGLEWTVEAPAIIYVKEDIIERYEPFTNKEEFIRNYLNHVPFNDGLMSELCGEYLLRPSKEGSDLMAVLAIKDSGLSFIDEMDVSWEGVKNNYRFLDGSTCGKKVRLEEFSTQRESQEVTSGSTHQNTNIRNPKNLKNGNKVPADAKLVGGTIFYIDDTADGTYEFFNVEGNRIEKVGVGDRPCFYRTVKKGSKDKYYVYYDKVYDNLRWTYYKDKRYVYEDVYEALSTFGLGKINTETVMAKDNGAYITADSNGYPTIWYKLQQVRNAKVGGCDDWFVPSGREMERLRRAIKKGAITGGTIAGSSYEESAFTNKWIWSSSQWSAQDSWFWYHEGPFWYNYNRSYSFSVFFARAF